MPLGSPWLSKPIKKPMKYPKMKPDWEKLLLHLVGIANRTKPGQVTHKIEEIKTLISEQEEQHKKEIEKLNDWRIKSNDGSFELGYEGAEIDCGEKIKELKQQHREQLEGLMKKQRVNEPFADESTQDINFGYNIAVDEINKAITNLLEQKGK